MAEWLGGGSLRSETLASISSWLGDRSLHHETLETLTQLLGNTSPDATPVESIEDSATEPVTEPVTRSTGDDETPQPPPREQSHTPASDPSAQAYHPLETLSSSHDVTHKDQSDNQATELETPPFDETIESMASWLGEQDPINTPDGLSTSAPQEETKAGSEDDPPNAHDAETATNNNVENSNVKNSNVETNTEDAVRRRSRQSPRSPVLRLGLAPALQARTLTTTPNLDYGTPIGSGTVMPSPAVRSRSPVWYLGLDIGTSGISAVLLNRQNHRLYPIYWRTATAPRATTKTSAFTIAAPLTDSPAGDRWFRLPLRLMFDPDPVSSHKNQQNQLHLSHKPSRHSRELITLTDLKPLLTLGIPHFSSHTGVWEPTVQWSSHQSFSLKAILQAIQTLLVTLTRSSPAADAIITAPCGIAADGTESSEQTIGLVCGAVGLGDEQLQTALRNLAQVILSTPSGWPDEYLINLQNLVLQLDLVRETEQIRWADEAIATILSELDPADGSSIQLPPRLTPQQRARQRHWQGTTLVLNAGAAVTHLAIAHLPSDMADLVPEHFTTHSVPFAGQGLDQDIITQMLYPLWLEVVGLQPDPLAIPHRSSSEQPLNGNGHKPQNGQHSEHRNGQRSERTPAYPAPITVGHSVGHSPQSGDVPLAALKSDEWPALALYQVPFPAPGQADPVCRHQLQQRLQGTAAGQDLIELARLLKVSLQHREEVVVTVNQTPYRFSRKTLGDRVLSPYVQMLDEQISLLTRRFSRRWNQRSDAAQHPITPIQQIVCSGGTASLRIVALWLRKCFPTATIVQDTYNPLTGIKAGARTLEAYPADWHNQAQQIQTTYTCSRTAYGLAMLPLYPNLAEAKTRAYADYFLLSELLQIMPDAPIDWETILFRLAQRGVQIDLCQDQVLALLKGQLPPGLQAGGLYQTWLARPAHPDTVELESITLTGTAIELFEQLNRHTYRVIPEYRIAFQRYLSTLFVTPSPRAQAEAPSLME